MLQPFDLIRSQADVQRVLLAWVTSCPTDDTIYFLEELVSCWFVLSGIHERKKKRKKKKKKEKNKEQKF